eukprot:TRINITY_DN18957_c1_g1_i3.p2 TRINITY_DN18957_c1_g1~~TRINITY_DN18957_c1_g1_i3.p2  ORF type:complete len:195 (-),score=25.04 TRINITY_DN18957_c1_g1_i3:843-1427(-)
MRANRNLNRNAVHVILVTRVVLQPAPIQFYTTPKRTDNFLRVWGARVEMRQQFGVQLIYKVEQELAGELPKVSSNGMLPSSSSNAIKVRSSSQQNNIHSTLMIFFSPIFLKAFSLTFLAEWGDRSQIATIGLATQDDVWGVTLGGILGHVICTGAAVLGGRHLALHINERTVLIVGGILFILFGLHAIYEGLYI